MASSSTLKPLASNPRCLFTPFSSPKYSPNRSLSLPFKSISFSLSCFHSDRKNSSLVECVAQKGSDIVEVAEDEEEEEDALSEEAKVFIGNLSYEVDSETLAEIFGRAGVVEIAEVIYDRGTNQSRGFAFVTMSTVEEADKAVEMFNRYDLNGRLLTVSKAAPKRAARPERIARVFDTTPKIYVGNLPWQVDNDRLEQIFSEHGKVMDARVIYDSETGCSRGFGFVRLSTETEVQNAIGALDGQSLEGRSIKVNIAESRPGRSF